MSCLLDAYQEEAGDAVPNLAASTSTPTKKMLGRCTRPGTVQSGDPVPIRPPGRGQRCRARSPTSTEWGTPALPPPRRPGRGSGACTLPLQYSARTLYPSASTPTKERMRRQYPTTDQYRVGNPYPGASTLTKKRMRNPHQTIDQCRVRMPYKSATTTSNKKRTRNPYPFPTTNQWYRVGTPYPSASTSKEDEEPVPDHQLQY